MSTVGSSPISSSAGSVKASGSVGDGDGDGPEDPIIEDYTTPLWVFVKKIANLPTPGGWKWQCNFCKLYFNGSYTRVRKHLFKGGGIAGCRKIDADAHAKMVKLVEECTARFTNPIIKPGPSKRRQWESRNTSGVGKSIYPADTHEPTIGDTKKKRKTSVGSGSGSIEKAFQNSAREECDAEVARMFYTGGLPFNFARNPHYRNSYYRASTLPGYVPPGYNALRTTHLAKEKKNIEKQLQPIKLTWKDKGVSICSDGWSDPQRRPLINVMAVNESGPMMLRAINCEGEFKDYECIANLIIESIKEVGYENVVQVVTDNAPVCAKAGALISSKYPTIFWTPCVVHTLNLALKNICTPSHSLNNMDVYGACSWIQPVVEDVMFIKNFIMNHAMRLVMFNDHCNLKLLSIAPTRFASTIIMFRRFKVIKNGLQQMVISPKWDDYRGDDHKKAALVKEKLLNDRMWDDIDYILAFTEPIYEIIRKADTDKPCLHLMYEWWDSMMEQVKKVIYRKERKQLHEESPFCNAVHKILMAHWTKSNAPLHGLAHSLNPKYYSSEWLSDNPHHVAPHTDSLITKERKICLGRYFADEDERRKVNIEFANFSMCMQEFGSGDAMKDRFLLEPLTWWVIHGASAPNLQSIAFKLLGQPCSSSCCERNWSTYNFIHSVKRNKLLSQKAEDLVFVHTNLRLLSRRSSSYTKGATLMWDVGGDEFDSLEDANVGRLGIANLSLDEPQLERELFDNGDGGGDIEMENIEEEGVGVE